MIVDLPAIRREVKKIAALSSTIIIESHYSHDISADVYVVLRSSPLEIRRRGVGKGWHAEKAAENIEAEIMETCKTEALSRRKEMIEYDTTGRTPSESAGDVALGLQERGLFLLDDIRIHESCHRDLRAPNGRLFRDFRRLANYVKDTTVITVGDYVSYNLHSLGVKPHVMVCDGMVRRKPFDKRVANGFRIIGARNPAGWITHNLWMACQKAADSKRPVLVEVSGEEDMAVIPFLLMSKRNVSIVYGLFDRGACVIKTGPLSMALARRTMKKILNKGQIPEKD
jgi:uncharacterized protein (UPF0218 family)